MGLLDAVLIGLLVLAAVVGYRRGAVLQLFTYGGLLIGLVAGALLAPAAARLVEDRGAQAIVAGATLLIAAGLGDLAGWLIGGRLRARTRRTRFRPADAVVGSVIGLAAVTVSIWILAFSLVNGPFPTLARQIQRSAVVRGLEETLPKPPPVLTEVRRFFNTLGFPDLFIGLPPSPAPPVRPPTQDEANAAFRAADQSTVKVVGEGCGRIQQGSGFVVDGGLVVTNAHVVAGVSSPAVESGTSTVDASIVRFDPRMDIAVLRTEAPSGPTLQLATNHVPRGTGGAVVGYPGGGQLTGKKAAVRRSLPANVSPDIYGDGAVVRRLYELQALVVPGNSGGPFVLPGGWVAGVVVSASTAEPDVAYAIASSEVVPLVEDAVARRTEVSTGPCLR